MQTIDLILRAALMVSAIATSVFALLYLFVFIGKKLRPHHGHAKQSRHA
jgi:hypothetical protein